MSRFAVSGSRLAIPLTRPEAEGCCFRPFFLWYAPIEHAGGARSNSRGASRRRRGRMRVPERLLLGPGPSPVSPRVMQAMGAPVISHLDPAMMSLLDDLRERLGSAFGAGDGALS